MGVATVEEVSGFPGKVRNSPVASILSLVPLPSRVGWELYILPRCLDLDLPPVAFLPSFELGLSSLNCVFQRMGWGSEPSLAASMMGGPGHLCPFLPPERPEGWPNNSHSYK